LALAPRTDSDRELILEEANSSEFVARVAREKRGVRGAAPTLEAMATDTASGLVYGMLQAKNVFPDIREGLAVVAGTGIGGAFYTESDAGVGQISVTNLEYRPAHPELMVDYRYVPEEPQTDGFVCIEDVASGPALLAQAALYGPEGYRNNPPTGEDLTRAAGRGHRLSRDLYMRSNDFVVHATIAAGRRHDLYGDPAGVVVSMEGALFDTVPGYAERYVKGLQYDHNIQYPDSLVVAPRPADSMPSLVGAGYLGITRLYERRHGIIPPLSQS
jgi:hypothetical protein